MTTGIVYIVKNPAFPHLIKIGKTSKNSVKDRGLDASNVAEDFEVLKSYECDNIDEVEIHLHDLFKQHRHFTRTGRKTEFFYVICEKDAIRTLEMLAKAGTDTTTEFQSLIDNKQSDESEYDNSKAREIYTEEDHTNKVSDTMVKLYKKFRNSILSLSDEIEIKPRKLYIGFKKGKNICDIEIQQKQLKIYINAKIGTLNDTKRIARDVSNIGTWGNGDYEIAVQSDKDIEYIMTLIKQIL